MDMEDHQIHHNQYGITDLRHLINGGGGGGGGRGGAPTATASAATSHLINILPSIPTPTQPPQIPSLSPPPPPPSFETMMMMGRPISAEMIVPLGLHHHHQPHQQHHQYHHDHHHHHGLGLIRSDNTASTANTVAAATSSLSGGGLEAETGGCLGGDGGTGRWPRQETLTLLEIRSRLDSKFKEANQKGPLWDEVSRIMSEEHGYQRSGKKCREKFENLYKYYKKTKEGKAGRQDGKHYRFFRQLEALYGETGNSNNNNNSQVISSSVQDYTMANNLRFHNLGNANAMPSNAHLSQLEGYNNISSQPHNKHCDSLSLSNNSSEFESSSSDDNNSSEKTRRNRARGSGSRGWKAKIKDFIDSQMRKLMEKQEAWLEKLMKTLEQKEKERGLREEEWRRQETARIDREHKFWAKERAWIEARDTALMEALKNLTGKEEVLINYKGINNISSPPEIGLNPNNVDDQDGSEIHENINVNVANQGDINHQNNWPESEIMRLIQLRTSMDSRFEQGGFSEEVLWEDIAAKMACLGYDRSSSMCREKWETINVDYAKKSKEMSNSKKRKEDSRECGYGNFQNTNNNESSTSLYNHGGGYNNNCDQMNDGTTSSSPNSNANVGNSSTSHHVVNNHDSCFPFLMGEGSENLWENYGLKINKGGQN